MKILVVTGIFPPDHGGPASYVPAIAQALSVKHTIVSVITLSDLLNHSDDNYTFPILRILRKANKISRTFRIVNTIRKYSKEADVIFVNGLIFESIVACKLFSRKPLAIKIVGDLIWEKAKLSSPDTVSIDEFQRNVAGIKWKILKWIYNKLINQCDAIIVPSLYLCRIVKGWGIDTAKINVVYNSVKPQSLPYANYGEGGNVDCVTVARLVPWKGISELIDVVCENKWTLNVIGDGPLKEDLVCRALKHSNNSVQFLGYVPRDQVHSEISKAKIFILNSTYEGLPHIVLEAKQAGVAVIATAVGGTPETITDGVDGYLIPPGDNAMLREKIGYLLSNNDKRTQVASKGREQVLHNFSFETMATKTEKILENTLNR